MIIHFGVGNRTPDENLPEAVWRRCHRRIIADYLLAAGEQVEHIFGKSHVDIARLTPGAVVRNDGTLVYPAKGPQSG